MLDALLPVQLSPIVLLNGASIGRPVRALHEAFVKHFQSLTARGLIFDWVEKTKNALDQRLELTIAMFLRFVLKSNFYKTQ